MTETAVENIKDLIRNFIVENFLFGDKSELIGDEKSFMENRIIDSTGILELVEFIEETYSIKVVDEELLPENLDSLNNVSLFVSRKCKNS